jgi:hypothetical protein
LPTLVIAAAITPKPPRNFRRFQFAANPMVSRLLLFTS